jgi:hypothetical protein
MEPIDSSLTSCATEPYHIDEVTMGGDPTPINTSRDSIELLYQWLDCKLKNF